MRRFTERIILTITPWRAWPAWCHRVGWLVLLATVDCGGESNRTRPTIGGDIEESVSEEPDAEATAKPDAATAEEPEGTTVSIDTGKTYQTLEGFGAALAWYAEALVGHPDKDAIYEHAFAELGLDILRLRNRFDHTDGLRDPPAEAEIIERATESLGRRPKIMITSWSPPAALKANGAEACEGAEDNSCTLAKDGDAFRYADFADYWYDSIEHYASLGIAPDYVSIQNEPGFVPAWEGCLFAPKETASLPGYDKALEAVHDRLASLDSPPRLLGPEVLGIHWGAPQKYLASLDRGLLYGIAHHLYEQGTDETWDWVKPGPESYSDEMRAVADIAGGLPLFQTEFQTDEDEFVNGGFETAWLIQNSLVVEGVSAWLYWDLVWGHSGLVALMMQDDQYTYRLRDQYFALRHFSRYTDPGYVRVEATSSMKPVLASAFMAPNKKKGAVVLLNTDSEERTFTLEPGSFGKLGSQIFRTVFRPGASKTWVDQGSLAEDGTMTLPTRSVATVVFGG